ncbi:DNA-binding protein [Peterkaempfera bronchialis]|uniref:DNA-binding protein n=1 Tax=Peterkaempfera bronchialis TaxID=2126346 RepID=UPI003C2FA9A3
MTQAEELLTAGAVLPPGTEGAGERAVELTARSYRHPGLDGRTVVRLVAGELGAAEDLAAGFLGLEPAAEPAVVGLGLRQSLGFPEWVLVHHPEDGHHALAVVPELERAARQAKSKPKAALDAYLELADRLGAAVPHFLPTFYEQAARAFLGVENATYAAQLFTRARRAEAEHGLTVDEDRLDAVFLEFALAGALPVKVLAGHAKELAARVPAAEAFRRFRLLCVRRCAGGLPPSVRMATDLRRLARAAGADPAAAEQEYLAELLELPATLRAPVGWWTSHRPALVALARRDATVRGALLEVMPRGGADLMELWLEVLEESGAVAGLVDGTPPEQPRPSDGVVGWLQRFIDARNPRWGYPRRLPALYGLVERAAGRLRAELAADGGALRPGLDLDLLDLLLSLDLPVADPAEDHWLRLEPWSEGEGQRALRALAADDRFRDSFHRGADRLTNDADARRTVRLLASSPGGRPLLTGWMRAVARRSWAGLPQLPQAMDRLTWLPGEALALAADEVAAAAGADLAAELARTLRGGIFDELGWPAWDEAVAALMKAKDHHKLIVSDAWPQLVVSGPAQARVIGADGTALSHDLRIPAGDAWSDPAFHWVDGELLVYWHSRHQDYRLRGYWHRSAGRVLDLETQGSVWRTHDQSVTLPLPGGGRTTGEGVLHPGDTAVPLRRNVIADAGAYWVWDGQEPAGWREYDPASGQHGRPGLPGFLADALRDAPAGSSLAAGQSWLRPAAPDTTATPAGIPVGGLLGWRAVQLPDGSWRGQDLAGRTVTTSREQGAPQLALTLPGDDRARALTTAWRTVTLLDPDGVATATATPDGDPGPFAAGSPLLPPLAYWHCLRPRDPEGSAALRRVDRETAAALLKAAAPGTAPGSAPVGDAELAEEVRALLPQVADEALVAGIAGVVRYAVAQQATLDRVGVRLAEALAGVGPEELPDGPDDRRVESALSGLIGTSRHWWGEPGRTTFDQLRLVGRALRAAPPAAGRPGPDGGLHLDGTELPNPRLQWWPPLLDGGAALAFRYAVETTPQEHRDTLRDLLGELDGLGFVPASGAVPWRLVTLRLDAAVLTARGNRPTSWRGLLPLDGGALLAVLDTLDTDPAGHRFTGLLHDPSGQAAPGRPYTVLSTAPVLDGLGADRLAAVLAATAGRGPAPWRPEAAEEFARLTGVSPTMARLVVAGMPCVDNRERTFLPSGLRTALGLKAADASVARDELRRLAPAVRRAVVAALLPDDPDRLWTDGPDVAAAAAVWIEKVGRRVAVPEWLTVEAVRAVPASPGPALLLPALLDPASSPELTRDLEWAVRRDRVAPVDQRADGFGAGVLTTVVALTGWLAHRLPAGDPVRAALPAVPGLLRDRLAHPGLMLDLGRYVNLPGFRKVAGTPTEVGDGWERYGAVIMATHDDQPAPGLRTALLDAAGGDPYLAALRGADQQPFPVEVALRTALSDRFAALLADPGDPAAGERDADGTWWPQDPTRSVPELVAEAAGEHGLGADAAALYLMLLAMPDPTDRATARWTGWKPRRLKAARAELAGSGLVVEASRARAGRSLFLPGGWVALRSPHLPLELWKLPLFDLAEGHSPDGAVVPLEPHADLYRRAWQRLGDGDAPRFEQLKVRRTKRR